MSILISAAELERLIAAHGCTVVDCRFELADPDKGRSDWESGHIPGAAYAHLDEDLSSPIQAHTGRHPLPESSRFAAFLAAIGWTPEKLLVAYDEGSGAIASRLWWLMRRYGRRAALLDGGLAAWVRSGRALKSGAEVIPGGTAVNLASEHGMVVETETVMDLLHDPRMLLLDARAAERFRGETENLDTRAGHIPGALNRPFGFNLQPNGRFKAPHALRAEFTDMLAGRDPAVVVHSCGSGVTACHNQFAMELAGLAGSRVYTGSWSEWIRDPRRPIETGG